jgi:acyl-CoA synthetase (AMP-forming)/AMP-acid ligase II
MLNIATNLERNAELLPEKVAVYFGDKTFTYAQLNGAANQVANGLKALGIGKGDKVVLSCPNRRSSPSSTSASSRRRGRRADQRAAQGA